MCNQLILSRGKNKIFEFIDVLLSRVESSDSASSVVRQWVMEGYGDKVLPIEIPKTSVAATASAEFGTVFDLPRGAMNSKTFGRARDAYERMWSCLNNRLRQFGQLNGILKERDMKASRKLSEKASKLDFSNLPGLVPQRSATTVEGEGANVVDPYKPKLLPVP